MLVKCVQLISPMFCPVNTSLVIAPEKIFNVKSKNVVHECETEFGVFPVTDVIDIRKSTFLVKYDLYTNCAKNCNDIVCILTLVKFSSMHYT